MGPEPKGIEGNKKVDKQAAIECANQNGNKLMNNLSPDKAISLIIAN